LEELFWFAIVAALWLRGGPLWLRGGLCVDDVEGYEG
jgi:hypothetical protein